MAEADLKANPTITVSVAELRANLSRYLKKAQAGASFVVMSRGKPVAMLGPDDAPAKLPPRQLGTLEGKIKIPDDFDDPLPDDVLDAFYAPL